MTQKPKTDRRLPDITFGPRPDDVCVDGVPNRLETLEDFERTLASIDSGRARYFRANTSMIADGRGDPNCIRVRMRQGDGLVTREIIDLHAAFGTAGVGNGNPELSRLVASFILHGTPNVPGTIAHRLLSPTLQMLRSVSGMSDGQVFFANDGTVVTEAAVRACLAAFVKKEGRTPIDGADLAWRAYRVVVAEGGYHGSSGIMRSFFRSDAGRSFGPHPACEDVVPFGDLLALERLLARAGNPKVAVVLLEPTLGVGGCIAPPLGYLQGVEALCRQYGAYLIFDEIKTGFGRLGEFFYSTSLGLKPDVICGGKSAGAGVVPLSFAIGIPEVMGGFADTAWGVTWTASPLQCFAMLAYGKFLKDGLLEDVRVKSLLLDGRLTALKEKYPGVVSRVDGIGLMRSVETVCPAQRLVELLREDGVHTSVILHPDKMHEVQRSVYVTPPLTITHAQLDSVIGAFDRALAKIDRGIG